MHNVIQYYIRRKVIKVNYQYQHAYRGKWTSVCARCTPRQKMKFDEVCSVLNKSKTELILGMIDDLYRKHVIGEDK